MAKFDRVRSGVCRAAAGQHQHRCRRQPNEGREPDRRDQYPGYQVRHADHRRDQCTACNLRRDVAEPDDGGRKLPATSPTDLAFQSPLRKPSSTSGIAGRPEAQFDGRLAATDAIFADLFELTPTTSDGSPAIGHRR